MQRLYWYAEPYFPSELVTLRSSLKKIPFLTPLSLHSQVNTKPPASLISVLLRWDADSWPNIQYLRDSWHRFGFSYVNIEKNQVYYLYPLGPLRFRLLLKDLETTSPVLCVNQAYWRLPFGIGSAWPAHKHLLDIITMKLVKEGYITIHGACLSSSKGEAALIVAPSQTGKTATVLFGQKEGYRLLSDDIIVSNGIELIPALTQGQKLWSGLSIRAKKGLKAYFQRIAVRTIERMGIDTYQPLLLGLAGSKVKDVYDKPAKLKYIIFLSSGSSDTITSMPKCEALRRLRHIQKAEFSWRFNPIVLNYEYHTGLLDLPSLEEAEDDILHTLVNNSSSCILIQSSNPNKFITLIKNIFQQ